MCFCISFVKCHHHTYTCRDEMMQWSFLCYICYCEKNFCWKNVWTFDCIWFIFIHHTTQTHKIFDSMITGCILIIHSLAEADSIPRHRSEVLLMCINHNVRTKDKSQSVVYNWQWKNLNNSKCCLMYSLYTLTENKSSRNQTKATFPNNIDETFSVSDEDAVTQGEDNLFDDPGTVLSAGMV